MRKNMRLVKMKNVDHIWIAKRLEENHVVVIVPARSGGDDRVRGRSLADRRGYLRLHSIPAVGVTHFRLVQNLKEHAILIPRRIVPRHGAPEIGEALDKVVFLEARFEIGVRMHVELYGKARVEDHFYSRIERAEIFGSAAVPARFHDGLRVYAEAYVVEAHGLDQCDVGGGGPVLEMFFRVSLGIVDLREPFAEINAVANVSEARGWNGRELACVLREC